MPLILAEGRARAVGAVARALLRATLDVPKPKSGGLVKKVGPFSKRKNPL